jgi:hypothetical protein
MGGHISLMEEIRHKKFWFENFKERDHAEEKALIGR